MAEILVLGKKEIESLFTLDMALQAVEEAYKEKADGSASVWPMVFHEFDPGHADLDIKSGDLGGAGIFGTKVVSWFGANPQKKKPALYGTSMIFDLSTGEPKALLNAGPITDLRTGAAGAIGAKYLARSDAQNLLMVGCGELAAYLIAATLRVCPGLKTVTLVNPHTPAKAAQRLPEIAAKVDALLAACRARCTASLQSSEDLENAVKNSDIILTATPSYEPLIKRDWLQPGTHLSCLGADMSGKQEIDACILAGAAVYGDDQAQCFAVGECEKAHQKGLLQALDGEIGQVILNRGPGRRNESQITVFDSTGIALQDLASAAVILQKAQQLGIGTRAEL